MARLTTARLHVTNAADSATVTRRLIEHHPFLRHGRTHAWPDTPDETTGAGPSWDVSHSRVDPLVSKVDDCVGPGLADAARDDRDGKAEHSLWASETMAHHHEDPKRCITAHVGEDRHKDG